MKLQILVGNSEIMFDHIIVVTKEKTFRFGNATMSKSMEEVYRYYDASDVKEITAKRQKF